MNERLLPLTGKELAGISRIHLRHLETSIEVRQYKLGSMDIIVAPDRINGSSLVANTLISSAKSFDRPVITCASGDTFKDSYKTTGYWVREHTQSNPFSQATGFQLDEYIGCSTQDEEGFSRYHKMHAQDMLNLLDFRFINGNATDPNLEAKRYDMEFRKEIHRRHITLLSTDPSDGHLAFIRPGTPIDRWGYHVTDLTDQTIGRDVNRGQHTRTSAITQGYQMLGWNGHPIDHIIFAAYGFSKGDLLAKAWKREAPTPDIPVSLLPYANASRITVILDQAAASRLNGKH